MLTSAVLAEDTQERPGAGWVRAGRLLLFIAAYLALAWLCKLAFPPEVQLVSFWLPSGLFVAVLLRADSRQWAGYLLAAAVANISFDLHDGILLGHASLYALGNCLESLAGAWLVRRFVAPRPNLSSIKQVAGVVGYAAVLSTAISATIGSTHVMFSEGIGFNVPLWLFWWGGNMLGILLVAPLILAWPSGSPWALLRRRPVRSLEVLAFFLLTSAACVFAFHYAPKALLPLTYLVIPCVLWAAFRYGVLATGFTNLLVAGFSAWYTTHYYSVFAVPGLSPHVQFASHQLSLAIVTLTGLFLAAALEQQRGTSVTLRESEEKFSKVFRRAPVLISIAEISTGAILEVNDEALRVSGYTRDEVVGRTAAELGWVTQEERQRLLRSAQERERAEGLEMQFRSKDGRVLFGRVYAERAADALRAAPASSSTAVDITG